MDRRNILIIVNLAIVILEIIGFALVFKELGTDAFIYYTEDTAYFFFSLFSICFSKKRPSVMV